jgi:hypothetical protein
MRKSTSVDVAADLFIGLSLIGLGLTKLHTGHDPGFALGTAAYHAAAIAELCLGTIVMIRLWLLPAYLLLTLMASVAILIGIANDGRQCGCLGSALSLSPSLHGAVASLAGSLFAYRACRLC